MNNYLGRHIIYDGESKSKRLKSIIDVYNFIEELSNIIDMTLVYPPIVARFPWANGELKKLVNKIKNECSNPSILEFEEIIKRRENEDSGVSGIGIQLESHLSVHTWPEKNIISIDVYSCKEYDHEKALNFISNYFSIYNSNYIVIDRYLGSHKIKLKV